jgi:acyl carrier protein
MKELDKIFCLVFKIKNDKNLQKSTNKNTKRWDSLTHINFILALQKKFKIKINDEDAMNILSYDDAIKYIKKRTNVK